MRSVKSTNIANKLPRKLAEKRKFAGDTSNVRRVQISPVHFLTSRGLVLQVFPTVMVSTFNFLEVVSVELFDKNYIKCNTDISSNTVKRKEKKA